MLLGLEFGTNNLNDVGKLILDKIDSLSSTSTGNFYIGIFIFKIGPDFILNCYDQLDQWKLYT